MFAQLDQTRPEGLRYASFKLPDGQSFVHLASIDTADGKNPLVALEAFRAFAREIEARCVEPPVTMALEPMGAFPAD